MTFEPSILALGAGMIGACTVLAVTVTETVRRRTRIKQRLEPLASMLEAGGDAPTATPVPEQAGEQAALARVLDRRYPLAGGTRAAFIGLAGAVAAGLALVPGLAFVGMPTLLAVLVGVLLAAAFGLNLAKVLEHRKRTQFNDRFLIAIEDLQRMVRFGISTGQALTSITASADEPVRTSLQRVARDAGLGVPLGVALGREAHRVRISEMAMLAAIVSTQSRTGGGLAESVANLAEMLRERIDNRSRMKAATSESKISLLILTGVPFAAIGIQSALQPELVSTLLNDARHLLGIGVGMIAAGLVVAWLMVRGAEK